MGVAMGMSKERLAGAIRVGFAPGILAVIKGRAAGAEAYLACMKDGEESPEDSQPEPVVLDFIEHKFDQPRDAESELRRRRRRGW